MDAGLDGRAQKGKWFWGGMVGLILGAAGLVAGGIILTADGSRDGTTVPSLERFLAPQGTRAVLAHQEFVVGPNRFAFAIFVNDRLLANANVEIRFSYVGGGGGEPRSTVAARFVQLQDSTPHEHLSSDAPHQHTPLLALYIVDQVVFDRAGDWKADFSVSSQGGERVFIPGYLFRVQAKPTSPGVGDPVPASRNLTIHDVDRIEEIESRIPPDGMHELSVARALEIGEPFVVVFATPAFCVSRLCGPVTEIAVELHARYRDRVNFLHIEPWDLKVARNEGRLVPTQTMLEWRLGTEPWVFVVDRNGRVAARFEGPVFTEELEAAIVAALRTKTTRSG